MLNKHDILEKLHENRAAIRKIDTWKRINNSRESNHLEIPHYLRSGITVDAVTLEVAVEMYKQGWRYQMPRPKSTQAMWGNSDGRTTWWVGFWYNKKNQKTSMKMPIKKSSGMYEGDGIQYRAEVYGDMAAPHPDRPKSNGCYLIMEVSNPGDKEKVAEENRASSYS
jgi:hypothetical protein